MTPRPSFGWIIPVLAMRKALGLAALVLCLSLRGEEAPKDATAAVPAASTAPATNAAPASRPPLVQRFHLFPDIVPASPPLLGTPGDDTGKRLFHQPGDPDSLFTFGHPTPEGELRLKAAIEVNDIILKALPPDLLVSPGDTRPRSAGSFSALDARGRPYQLRLGARLVW